MTWYSREDAAERAGVKPEYLVRLADLGILSPEGPDRFSPGDVRRVLMSKSLEDAGIPLEGVAAAIHRGALSLAFMDAASYERFAALAPETFRQSATGPGSRSSCSRSSAKRSAWPSPRPMTGFARTRWRQSIQTRRT